MLNVTNMVYKIRIEFHIWTIFDFIIFRCWYWFCWEPLNFDVFLKTVRLVKLRQTEKWPKNITITHIRLHQLLHLIRLYLSAYLGLCYWCQNSMPNITFNWCYVIWHSDIQEQHAYISIIYITTATATIFFSLFLVVVAKWSKQTIWEGGIVVCIFCSYEAYWRTTFNI